MIEAVNSVVASAQALRGPAEQGSVVRGYAANPDRLQEARPLPQAPYISPYISVDLRYDRAVVQIRDSDTGDVVRQFPSETAMRARQSVQAYSERAAQFEEPSQSSRVFQARQQTEAPAPAEVKAETPSSQPNATPPASAAPQPQAPAQQQQVSTTA